jgi:hypothetical protein
MAERENDSEASTALPKLLLEIVNQVEENDEKKKMEDVQKDGLTTEEESVISEVSGN